MVPSALYFNLYTHLLPNAFFPYGKSSKVHVPLSSRAPISFPIELFHSLIITAFLKWTGSTPALTTARKTWFSLENISLERKSLIGYRVLPHTEMRASDFVSGSGGGVCLSERNGTLYVTQSFNRIEGWCCWVVRQRGDGAVVVIAASSTTF